MKKETQSQEIAKIQKENIIVFKKRSSGKIKPQLRQTDKEEEFEGKFNFKPKPQLFSQQSIKSEKKTLPLLGTGANNAGKKIIIQKALLEYSKNLPPTSMYHDKEALLQESIQLKQKNNDLANENIKLKTRLSTVEKQNLRLQKLVQEDQEAKRPATNKDIKAKSSQLTMTSIKGLLKDCKRELQETKQENNKIKKSVKFTRIGELQQETKSYQQECTRLRQLLEEQFNQNVNNQLIQHDLLTLQHKVAFLNQGNSLLKKQNAQSIQKIKILEEKLKGYSRLIQSEKNLNKVISNLKKSLKQKQTDYEQIKKQLKEESVISAKEKQEKERQKQKTKIVSSKKIPQKVQKIQSRGKCQECPKQKLQISKLEESIKKLQVTIIQKDKLIEKLSSSEQLKKPLVKKPSPQSLKHVSQFLQYRFKAHHLSISQIQKYLIKKDTTKTAINQIIEILLAQPFFITNSQYLETLIIHLFYHDRTQEEFQIDEKFQKQNPDLLKAFKQFIGEYAIMEQTKEQQMFIQIAELITNYSKNISAAFDSKRNGEGTIDRVELYDFLNQIELEKQYIQFIITQIILDSFDLEHLNYYALFEIFYLPVQQELPSGKKPTHFIENQIKEQDEQYEESQSIAAKGSKRKNNNAANEAEKSYSEEFEQEKYEQKFEEKEKLADQQYEQDYQQS